MCDFIKGMTVDHVFVGPVLILSTPVKIDEGEKVVAALRLGRKILRYTERDIADRFCLVRIDRLRLPL